MSTANSRSCPRPIDILMVDDDLGDIALTQRALENGELLSQMHVANDGVEAMEFLRQKAEFVGAPRPDLILLDLNMPRKDGRELLAEIKADPNLRAIPVVILTTSDAEDDIARLYEMQANCFLNKPFDLGQYTEVVQAIKQFWLTLVKLPRT